MKNFGSWDLGPLPVNKLAIDPVGSDGMSDCAHTSCMCLRLSVGLWLWQWCCDDDRQGIRKGMLTICLMLTAGSSHCLQVTNLDSATGSVESLLYSHSADMLYTGTANGTVVVWQ